MSCEYTMHVLELIKCLTALTRELQSRSWWPTAFNCTSVGSGAKNRAASSLMRRAWVTSGLMSHDLPVSVYIPFCTLPAFSVMRE